MHIWVQGGGWGCVCTVQHERNVYTSTRRLFQHRRGMTHDRWESRFEVRGSTRTELSYSEIHKLTPEWLEFCSYFFFHKGMVWLVVCLHRMEQWMNAYAGLCDDYYVNFALFTCFFVVVHQNCCVVILYFWSIKVLTKDTLVGHCIACWV